MRYSVKNSVLLLLLLVLSAGSSLYGGDKKKAPPANEIVNGTLSSIDLERRIIVVGGTYIHLPALGSIDRKPGEKVSVMVRRNKNREKVFLGFVPVVGVDTVPLQ